MKLFLFYSDTFIIVIIFLFDFYCFIVLFRIKSTSIVGLRCGLNFKW
ncbi:hypothetical protein LEQ41_07710 [Streptococcus agalactiae]|nr:hypothetical protein [Streptococcus agalactiae]